MRNSRAGSSSAKAKRPRRSVTARSRPSLETARDHFEKTYVVQALARNAFNVTRTAKEIDLSRQHLQNLIKKHGITRFTDSDEQA